MSREVAEVIAATIGIIGGIAWLSGLRFLSQTSKRLREVEGEDQELERLEAGDSPKPIGLVRGEQTIAGRAADLSKRAAAVLAESPVGWAGPIRILEQSDHLVRFESIPTMLTGRSNSIAYQSDVTSRIGEIKFESVNENRTRVRYQVETASGQNILRVAWLIQLFGFVFLVGGIWLAFSVLIPSPNPAIRTQSIQLVQAVHFLWPPFMLGSLVRSRRRAVQTTLDVMISNLPYGEGQR